MEESGGGLSLAVGSRQFVWPFSLKVRTCLVVGPSISMQAHWRDVHPTTAAAQTLKHQIQDQSKTILCAASYFISISEGRCHEGACSFAYVLD